MGDGDWELGMGDGEWGMGNGGMAENLARMGATLRGMKRIVG